MRFKNSPQLPGAGKARAWHHHGSDTPTSPRAVLHHTDANLCTILHTTVVMSLFQSTIVQRIVFAETIESGKFGNFHMGSFRIL